MPDPFWPSDLDGGAVGFDPGFEGGARLEAGDQRVARGIAVVNDDVPQALGVDDETGTLVQRDTTLGRRVGQTVGAIPTGHLTAQNRADNAMDIFDININEITKQYLEYIKSMKQLDLENAGDFVAMAATLIQIKSKMLLPQYNENGEEIESEDPRKELVSKLLEYQKFQDAAQRLYDRPILGRDLFLRGERFNFESEKEGEIIVEDNALFALISAYRSAIRNMKKGVHKVTEALQSISDRILEIKDKLVIGKIIGFFELIQKKEGEKSSNQVLVTFISLLELAKMGFVSLFQADDVSEIRIEAKNAVDRDVIARVEDYDNAHSNEVAAELLGENKTESTLNIEDMSESVMNEVDQKESDEDAKMEFMDAASDEDILEEERKLELESQNDVYEENLDSKFEDTKALEQQEEQGI